MDKHNFDSLKNLKAPQEWIEKAALIPESTEKRRAFPLYHVTAAASVVLVALIGLSAFLLFGRGQAPIIVHGQPDATTAETLAVGHAETVGVTENSKPTDAAVSPTRASQAGSTEFFADSTEAPAKPAQPATEKAADPTVYPTAPSAPTVAPTNALAEPPTAPSILPTTPPPTTPPATEAPTDGMEVPAGDGEISFSAVFSSTLIGEGEPLYCTFWEQDHYASSMAIDDDHKSRYSILKNGMALAMYEALVPASAGDDPHVITYEYIFYNSRGQVIARGTESFVI